MRRMLLVPVVLALASILHPADARAAALPLTERIEAQRRIEAVYWSERTWPADNKGPKPALADVLDEKTLAAHAEAALRKTGVLAHRFGVTIDAALLRGEVERMERDSRDPARLRRLFAALNDDPLLVAEVLARPIVADRLLGEIYERTVASGTRGSSGAHGSNGTRAPGFGAWWETLAADPDAGGTTPVDAGDTALSSALTAPLSITAGACTDDTWTTMTVRSPTRRANAIMVWTGNEMLMWGGWSVTRNAPDAWSYSPATNAWTRLPDDPVVLPDATTGAQTGVWSGTELLIYGNTGQGRRYNPATKTWRAMADGGEGWAGVTPAVWTGSRMLIWNTVNVTGYLYDPAADSWAPMSSVGAPVSRDGAMSVWAGNRFVVWGGTFFTEDDTWDLNDGALYDPASDTWTPTSVDGAPNPVNNASIAWTGTEVVIWGGGDFFGGRYNPATDTWSAISPAGQPDPARHYALATAGAGRFLVWGGRMNDYTDSGEGGRYDLATDTWTPITMTNAPGGRHHTTPVWTGTELIVWGGEGGLLGSYDDGARYDPVTDTWTTMAHELRPVPRTGHAALWTGAEMLVWGGSDADDGWAYDPATDAWRALPAAGQPDPRSAASAVWTGSEMLVWGGCCIVDTALPFGTGARYNPTTNAWSPMTTSNAPLARYYGAAAWTGTHLLVWGGLTAGGETNTGARYDAATDTWTPMTTSGAPAARLSMASVWTGSLLLVWSGYSNQVHTYYGDGARYDAAADTWTPMSPVGAAARAAAASAWTGTEMVVWSGLYSGWYGTSWPNDTWRYRPSTDTWTLGSVDGGPGGRTGESAVWAGTKMIVWGGGQYGAGDSGSRYDPVANTWSPTRQDDTTPLPSNGHSAVWTGAQMIVFGGGMDVGALYCSAGCVPVTWYRDADGDGAGNAALTQSACTRPAGYVAAAGDCNDGDASAWGTPGEAVGLRLTRSGSVATLTWSAPLAPGGTADGTRYDTLRSTLASDFGASSATCVTNGSSTLQATDATSPGAAHAFYYLVRATNACPAGASVGSLGVTSSGAERVGRACP